VAVRERDLFSFSFSFLINDLRLIPRHRTRIIGILARPFPAAPTLRREFP
jgi:hypothetical protein